MGAQPTHILLKGVRQNNLQNIDVEIPIGSYTVVTGLSGSGKSSLVFETLHAEGQRRYLETFNTYTRQFLERMDRPEVDAIEHVPASIAIEQNNHIRSTRSTVGTLTELCDYFKVWFSQIAELFDPKTGELIRPHNPESIWETAQQAFSGQAIMIGFSIQKPQSLDWAIILQSLIRQGYQRGICLGKNTEDLNTLSHLAETDILYVIQDRLHIDSRSKNRFLESIRQALHSGKGSASLISHEGKLLQTFRAGWNGADGTRYLAPTPSLFSFNSPIGACPQCKGFGRIIEIDYNRVIPDQTLSIEADAIRAFQGEVYGNSKADLLRAARKYRIRTHVPYAELTPDETHFLMEGQPDFQEFTYENSQWYGLRRFFDWLETQTYKMHVRVFLSRYRHYTTCPTCNGSRLQREALYWKWNNKTLPELYQLNIDDLLTLIQPIQLKHNASLPENIPLETISKRLNFLRNIGLGYLSLDRSARTLSGGEHQRVTLTTCLATGLTDTLFVLDEPSIGMHASDTHRLLELIDALKAQGNTIVIVEHDETLIRAADHVIEIGPGAGHQGGKVVFSGSVQQMIQGEQGITGAFLNGSRSIRAPLIHRNIDPSTAHIALKHINCQNIKSLSLTIPIHRWVTLCGVSGSGKSTLMEQVLFAAFDANGKQRQESKPLISIPEEISGCQLIDQTPLSRTPRSNPMTLLNLWDSVRDIFSRLPEAQDKGMSRSHFSFNCHEGRCPHCEGLGYEKTEMQFMADLFSICPDCDGRQFIDSVCDIRWKGYSVVDLLRITFTEALTVFADHPVLALKIELLIEAGLGYLTLGQPLNTLSGGESQRLKLLRYLPLLSDKTDPNSLLLLDEPTTGLHLADIAALLKLLQKLVDQGHSLLVIEHHPDVIRASDWVIEMGPGSGPKGGRIIFTGTPDQLCHENSPTAHFLKREKTIAPVEKKEKNQSQAHELRILGAREHNLKNLSLNIPLGSKTVISGVSGSGKSSLAFDVIFAEGQRRFLESQSTWARQYIEQLPRPDVDQMHGIQPTVAIEQRSSFGTAKSTIGTFTEVAQYLRILFSKAGVQHSPISGKPLTSDNAASIAKRIMQIDKTLLKKSKIFICFNRIYNRKGHHQPVADWALKQGFHSIRTDGIQVKTSEFKRLNRFQEHTIDVISAGFSFDKHQLIPLPEYNRHWETLIPELLCDSPINENVLQTLINHVFTFNGEHCFIASESDKVLLRFSQNNHDPDTGITYPTLTPRHFSWNSEHGCCTTCQGYGILENWMSKDERFTQLPPIFNEGEICPECNGQRLNPTVRAVKLQLSSGGTINLPEMLSLTATGLLKKLTELKLNTAQHSVLNAIKPELESRLIFMDTIGLDYLTLDRSMNSLSNGEAQRTRLSAQLGSNLSGVMYILDEPSIGLHPKDSQIIMRALNDLCHHGNTLLIVEHDPDIIRAADYLIDIGPDAGIHGGKIMAAGTLETVLQNPNSITAQCLQKPLQHPLRESYRALSIDNSEWIYFEHLSFRSLKNLKIAIPRQRLILVCGVSGSGKSTLMHDIIHPAIKTAIIQKKSLLTDQFHCAAIRNGDSFLKVIEIDQAPIGRTPRSTPALYTGVFDEIRRLFGQLPEAKMRGFSSSSFSFNTKGGRCEACMGAGRIRLEMSFMSDTFVECDTCGGKRYTSDLLEIRYNGLNIHEVLNLTFEEAFAFFSAIPRIRKTCALMTETGLGYLRLGQPSTTLSGGEAQRLKLVSELTGSPDYKKGSVQHITSRTGNLYLLEEPTIGLHLWDCRKLIDVLHRLVDQGHTVIVIEHHIDLIGEADYVIELGPGSGKNGGQVIFQGTIDEMKRSKKSVTRPFLS
jgi:excinuclease ABC subunit A